MMVIRGHYMKNSIKSTLNTGWLCILLANIPAHAVTVKDVLFSPEALILASVATTTYTSKVPIMLVGLTGIQVGSVYIKNDQTRAECLVFSLCYL
jgi:hypothetical protein